MRNTRPSSDCTIVLRVLLITRILPSIAIQSNQPIEASTRHLSAEQVNAWIYAPLINILASRYRVESCCMHAKLNDVNRGWLQPHRIVLVHLLSAHYAPPRSQSIASLPELSLEKTRKTPKYIHARFNVQHLRQPTVCRTTATSKVDSNNQQNERPNS